MKFVNDLTKVVIDVGEATAERLGAEWKPFGTETSQAKPRKTTSKKK